MIFKNLQVGDFFVLPGKTKVYEKVGGCSAEGTRINDYPFDIGGLCRVDKVEKSDNHAPAPESKPYGISSGVARCQASR